MERQSGHPKGLRGDRMREAEQASSLGKDRLLLALAVNQDSAVCTGHQ
jgi:hypothetical protein